jgi:hypothetical protein
MVAQLFKSSFVGTTAFLLITMSGLDESFPFRHIPEALAQESNGLIQQLESESNPSKDDQGNVVKHINPADVIIWDLAGHNFDQASHQLKITLALSTKRQFTIYVDKLKFVPSEGWRLISMKPPASSRHSLGKSA